MLFTILGPVRARQDGRDVALGAPRQRAVLVALLAQPNTLVPLESLVHRVWDDDPPAGVRSVLYTYITRLRGVFHDADEVGLARGSGGYRLEVDPARINISRFVTRTRSARERGLADCERARRLDEALSLWYGEPFADVTSSWATGVRKTLEDIRVDAVVDWADAMLRLDAPDRVVTPLRSCVAAAPLVESLWVRLITALYRAGRAAEALDEYHSARKTFGTDLGVQPSAQMQRLFAAILAGGDVEVPVRPRDAVEVARVGQESDSLAAWSHW